MGGVEASISASFEFSGELPCELYILSDQCQTCSRALELISDKRQNHEPHRKGFDYLQASAYMDYDHTDNSNMTRYGSGHGDLSPSLHDHMIAGSSGSSSARAAGNHGHAGVEGLSGGIGRASQCSPSESTILGFLTVSHREEPIPHVCLRA